MKPDLCPRCGLNMKLVGLAHNCVVPEIVSAPEPMPPMPVVATLPPSPSPNIIIASPNSAYARNARWREKNRKTYNAYMQDLMRQKRATAKAARAS